MIALEVRKNGKRDVHLHWKSVAPLKIGDVIEVRIIETVKVDRAISRTRANKNGPKPL